LEAIELLQLLISAADLQILGSHNHGGDFALFFTGSF
jgi:hypothetical protein